MAVFGGTGANLLVFGLLSMLWIGYISLCIRILVVVDSVRRRGGIMLRVMGSHSIHVHHPKNLVSCHSECTVSPSMLVDFGGYHLSYSRDVIVTAAYKSHKTLPWILTKDTYPGESKCSILEMGVYI
jgi:hypothetical protein